MDIDCIKIQRMLKILNSYFKMTNENLANVEYPVSIALGSQEWLYYNFYSCLLDYGMRSKIYHQNLITTYERHPEIFKPQYVVETFINNEEILGDIIKKNIHPRYPVVALKKWIKLSNELIKYNDLLDAISSLNSYIELEGFIKRLGCYGQKTGGLLLRLIYDSRICNFTDDMQSIPLDRHDIEISFLNSVIEKKDLSEREIRILADAYIKVGHNLNINVSNIDKYLWEIGNKFCNKKNCLNCPLFNTCRTKIRRNNDTKC